MATLTERYSNRSNGSRTSDVELYQRLDGTWVLEIEDCGNPQLKTKVYQDRETGMAAFRAAVDAAD